MDVAINAEPIPARRMGTTSIFGKVGGILTTINSGRVGLGARF